MIVCVKSLQGVPQEIDHRLSAQYSWHLTTSTCTVKVDVAIVRAPFDVIVCGKSLMLGVHVYGHSLIPHTLLLCHENGCGMWPHLLTAYLRSCCEATVSSPEFVSLTRH